MARNRKPLPTLEHIAVSGVAAEGNAIARVEGHPVIFIPFGAPGDIVTVKLDRKKGSWAQGHIVALEQPSERAVLRAFRNMRRLSLAAPAL